MTDPKPAKRKARRRSRANPEIKAPAHAIKLGELPATAICGNDISSSCLYVSALAIVYSGKYAWVALLIVAAVLYLFRRIYGEVVGALPLNGGAYNALLNTTSKSVASLAACLTLLSYMATAVISANEAMHYVHVLLDSWPVIPATIGLLAFFMILSIIGIRESSRVAIAIFVIHLSTLSLLVLWVAGKLLVGGFEVLSANFTLPTEGGLLKALFFGFSAAMLGISGFESSANFVEEQDAGVFPKTLRNMWIVVTVFNPLTAFLALAILPMTGILENKEALLSEMGRVAAGGWLAWLVSIDAALVLSGAVLTSFVGVGGLVQRMALDRILPQFFLRLNRRNSPYRIAVMFFLLSVSVLLITKGELGALAGVYTISFLLVMALFGLGNVLLKVKRSRLPRPERAHWLALLVAIPAVLVALTGNVVMNPIYLGVFLEYFVPTIGVIAIMLYRVDILRGLLHALQHISDPLLRSISRSSSAITRTIDRINAQEFVFFTKGDNVAGLNRVMRYVTDNEHTRKLKIVTLLKKGEEVPSGLRNDVAVLDRAYPEISIDFQVLPGEFGPQMIQRLSNEWQIPPNFMFIGSPGDRFPFGVADLGGVRLII
jgi:amino acid transporter